MNYYERHLGDYAKDTAHLSLVEHGVYTLLLDRIYATEAGIPIDQVHRIARARTADERAAVDAVVAEFFAIQDGVLVNGRALQEIEKARVRIEAARTNGRTGGRPKANPEETHREPTGFVPGNPDRTQTKAHHVPDTSIHTPGKQKQKPPSATPTAAAYVPPAWVPAEAWAGFDAMRRRERHPLTVRAASLIVLELQKLQAQGHDPAAVLDQSTRNGWRDVFPIRTAALGPRAGPTAKPKTVAAYDAIGARIDELSAVVPSGNRPRIAGPDPA